MFSSLDSRLAQQFNRMKTEKANLDEGNEKYSKIDLANVDSYMPQKASLFLSRTISGRCWSQIPEAGDSNGANAAEWEGMPKVARDYHLQMELDLLESEVVQLPVEDGPAEGGDAAGESVPFYY